MTIADLSPNEIARRMAGEGLALDFGAARVRVRTDVPALAASVHRTYAGYPVEPPAGVFHATAWVRRARGVRRYFQPQIHFVADGVIPFEPFPADTHLPFLEWGINWAIADRCNDRLLLHAGAVEKDGVGIVLPALPGSGKSTLIAALALSGYRLLSDEFGVVRLSDAALLPMVRPIALKNASIGLVAQLFPHAPLGPVFPRTRKGDVAHLAPGAGSVRRRHEPATAAIVLFPFFEPGAATQLEAFPRARACAKIAVNSFNYEYLGQAAFAAVVRLVERCECFRLRYSNLQEAVALVDSLVAGAAAENTCPSA